MALKIPDLKQEDNRAFNEAQAWKPQAADLQRWIDGQEKFNITRVKKMMKGQGGGLAGNVPKRAMQQQPMGQQPMMPPQNQLIRR